MAELEPYQLAAAVAGVVMLVAAVLWRTLARRHAVSGIRRALLDEAPETRQAAVRLAAERGLSRFADVLLARAEHERDAAVRKALAEAVARAQWEPASRPELVELRLWAHRLLSGELPAPAPAPEPAPQPQPNPAPAPAPLAELSAETRPISRVPTVSSPGGVSARPRPRSRRSAGAITVLVTGAGGPAGVAVIRALRAAGHRVVAGDADRLAVGLRLAHESVVLPNADDPALVDAVCEAAEDHGATALVSTVAEELAALAEGEPELHGAGLATWLPDPVAAASCLDKWRFAQEVAARGVAHPATAVGTATGVPGPWVVKPRFGRGSRGVHLVDRADELAWVLPRVDQPIVQTRVDGREFTIDVLVDRDGSLAGAVPRWRLETKSGVSTKGRTFDDEVLVKEAAEVLAAVGLTGPANVQGFLTVDGAPCFIEVNPRFSGGLPLALAAGADLVGEYLRGVLGHELRRDRLAFRPGLTMVRHYEEIFE